MLDCQILEVSPSKFLEQIVDHLLALLFVAHDGRDLGFDVRSGSVWMEGAEAFRRTP